MGALIWSLLRKMEAKELLNKLALSSGVMIRFPSVACRVPMLPCNFFLPPMYLKKDFLLSLIREASPSSISALKMAGNLLNNFLCYSELENAFENGREKNDEDASQSKGRENTFEQSLFPDEDRVESVFFQKVLTAVQNWFTLFGWSKGPNPISIPCSLRRDICKVQMTSSQEKGFKQNLGKDTKTIYDMLLHLSGQLLPGITTSQSLPSDPLERVVQLHWQHSTMITFLNQGACLPHVMPEFLLELDDYKNWIRLQIALKVTVMQQSSDPPNDKHLLVLDDRVFETMSKRVWMDVLLQVYKVLVLPRVSPLNISNLSGSETMPSMPRINTESSSSNIYSSYERNLLTWLNKHYEKNRKIVWKNCQKVPPVRWIVNFDRDLLDGLVLAAQVAAYCPYLISTHFVNMYTHPETPEQCLHNCLILVSAFRVVSLDIDIQVNGFIRCRIVS
uniref:Calponin-homology (CH) domain-containing protein n=1 Tax=Crocodylus porosus TaxID=8502 RepID=A0A7M4E4P9_CROPO